MKIKKKLRDLTEEEYREYLDTHCEWGKCSGCIFQNVTCAYTSNHSWIKNKDLFSDKFLNQEIEIEIEARGILDEKEKEYLSAVIKPFRNRIKSIGKFSMIDGLFEYISMEITLPERKETDFNGLPLFKTGTMYKNMELRKKYTLEELGL